MIYSNEELQETYSRLSPEYQRKASGFLKNLLTVQRAEKKIENAAQWDRKKLEEEYEELGELLRKDYDYPSPYKGKVYCSFCNKSEDHCRKLIAGPHNVIICDECINICREILEEEMAEDNGEQKNG